MPIEIDFLKIIPNKELSMKCREILNTRTGLEREGALGRVLVEHLDEMSYKPDPEMPVLIKDYYAKKNSFLNWDGRDEKDRNELMASLMSRESVQKYFVEIDAALAKNLQSVDALEKVIAVFLGQGDKVNGGKCWNKYVAFPDKLFLGTRVIWLKRREWGIKIQK